MLQKFVIGTLTALNSVMSPLDGKSSKGPIHTTDVAPQELAAISHCRGKERPSLRLQLDPGKAATFHTLHVQGKLCRERQLEPIAFAINLPSDLADEEFVLRLPVNVGFIVKGVPSVKTPGAMSRIKLTRLAQVGDEFPVLVEWLSHSGVSEHEPLTVWFNPENDSSFPWRKIEIGELKPALKQAAVSVTNIVR